MTDLQQPKDFPRLIYNSDGDSTTLSAFRPPITPDQACRDIDEVVGTGVDVFTNSIGRGDETLSHPSAFGEIYGDNVDEWPEDKSLQWLRRMAENARSLLDDGTDIIDLLADRAHSRGLRFWPALRMNDNHEDEARRFGTLRSTFKKEHPELLLGHDYPRVNLYRPPENDYTWCFDFAREEVRERKLGLILETCEKYDVDGFEMDFQRGPWYFKDGQQEAGLPLMTDFLRSVRSGSREIAQKKGRPFTLMARVPPTVDRCLDRGLDVTAWIREDLADLFVPMDEQSLDLGAEVRRFVDLAKGTRCRIGGGLEHRYRGYGARSSIPASPDMLYAGALSYWHQGASFIYLFNYDCHRAAGGNLPYEPSEVRVLDRLHDPTLIARENKRYWVTMDIFSRTVEEGGLMPLPAELTPDTKNHSFTIWIGDDIEAAKREDVLESTWLRIAFTKHHGNETGVSARLNDELLKRDHRVEAPDHTTVIYRDLTVLQGENRITIAQDPDRSAGVIRIQAVELIISYR